MRGRVFRAIAIFFLVYTGVDFTVPQICCEEMGTPGFVAVSASAGENSVEIARMAAAAFSTDDSQEGLPSERPSSDEDCFCCCAHVVPGRALPVIAASDLTAGLVTPRKIDLPSPPLQSAYHPPRLA